ncbi:hypothetical protein BVY00_00870 [bacterium G20]|nr:hypothetical protein BVY00_00870 [bacterium G20]
MDKRDRTAAIVDGTLNFLITGSAVAGGLLIPNLLVALDKPLNMFWKQLDKREREREMRRAISYMKTKQLISGNYQHGLQITSKGRQRLKKIEFDKISINRPTAWDRKWRLVFFDIPEAKRHSRISLINKLKQLDFYQLQKSAWIHPFPCRKIIEAVAAYYDIDSYISYVEVVHIDNQEKLIKQFNFI